MKHKRRSSIMITRKIEETGLNVHGQHIFINSTTIHNFDGVNAEDWELLANFEDAIKLTIRGKSIKVYCVL